MAGCRLFGERSKQLRQPGRARFEFLSAAVHVLQRCQHQRRAVFPRLALRPRGEQRQSARDRDADLTAHVHRSCGGRRGHQHHRDAGVKRVPDRLLPIQRSWDYLFGACPDGDTSGP